MRILLSLILSCIAITELSSLPTYSFRSSRVCENCHSTPFKNKKQEEWKNPEVAKRKCNMSCQTCHVNPAGGGMRNAPGRYYSVTTLPSFGATKRDYHDANNKRELWQLFKDQNLKKKKAAPKAELSSVDSDVELPTEPTSAAANPAPSSKFEPKVYYPLDPFSYGYPLDASTIDDQSEYSFDRDRYGPINADPLIAFGLNARFAYYANAGNTAVFPMQFDLGSAVHPIEHLTISATGGLQGRSGGLNDPAGDGKRIKLQNAFVLLHEFPYQSYIQAGVYLPEFGLRFDDHTIFGRRHFEMSTEFSDNNVRGIQLGTAPNYPYASVSVFETVTKDIEKTGTGVSANLAWRDIEWGLGSSYLQKNRSFANGGDLYAISLNGYYNLWALFPSTRYTHPIIVQFEYNAGQKPRSEFTDKRYSTWLFQLDYLVLNGVNLRSAYQFYDADWDIKNDSEHRISWGFDWTALLGLRLSFDWRLTWLTGGSSSADLIAFLHGYF